MDHLQRRDVEATLVSLLHTKESGVRFDGASVSDVEFPGAPHN